VEVILDSRKRITIRVSPLGEVTVQAPLAAGIEGAAEAIRRKTGWLHRSLEKLKSNPPVPVRMENGAVHYFLGEPRTLRIVPSARAGAHLERETLTLFYPDPRNEKALEGVLRRWYRQQALALIPGRAERWGNEFRDLPEYSLGFRWMRRRWGSCTSGRKIVINTQLVKATPDCMDFVVVHELCHLVHHDHGPGFRMLLGSVLPGWRETRGVLRALPLLL
jgi:predicted metal-dependent hydrolase